MLISHLKKDNNQSTSLKDVRVGSNTFKKNKEQEINSKTQLQVSKKLKIKKDKLLRTLKKQ